MTVSPEGERPPDESYAAGDKAPAYRRVVLKLSGESLGADDGRGLSPESLERLTGILAGVVEVGVELALVVGGGNIIRGIAASARGLGRRTADYMGMTATIINALALEDSLNRRGIKAVVLSPLGAPELAEHYVPRLAARHLEEGRVVLLAGGTGHPFFSTDTAAALRAVELGAQALVKATKVDGVYTADPLKDPGAKKLDRLSYLDFLKRGLKVMDATAVTLCMDHQLPIVVLSLSTPEGLVRVLRGESLGTLVGEEEG